MSKQFFQVSCAIMALLIAVPAANAVDPRTMAGNSPNKVVVGNDQNRKAISGFNVLGGGPKKVDQFFTNKKIRNQPTGLLQINTKAKAEADQAYLEGLAAEQKGNLVDAGLAMRKSINIREQYFSQTDKQIPEVKQKLAEIWVKMDKKDEAIGMFQEALAGYNKYYGIGTEHRVKALIEVGNIYMEKSDYRGAVDSFNQAYILTARAKGANAPDTMKLRLQLAATNRAAKSLDLAASLYNECFAIQKSNEKLIDKEQLIASLQDYCIVLKDLKKDDEAAKIQQRIAAIKAQGESTVAAGEAQQTKEAAATTTPPPESK